MLPTRYIFSLLLLLMLVSQAQAQGTNYDPYFQQHVHYRLDATMNDEAAKPTLDGNGSLEYTNNSRDTLTEVYFHLYYNLFRNGSYGERAPNRDHREDADYGSEGITITDFGQITPVKESNLRDIEIDNTILRLKLRTPISPGATRTFSFAWRAELPNFGIRSTWGYHGAGARNFATAQWYPQICVYDQHGWHPDQYVGMGEFYTDYGSFDVSLHLPANLTTVVSTGWQTNTEMLPASTRERLQFAKEHPDSIVRVADFSTFLKSTEKKPLVEWRFHADSVRDFAWCADEAYIWDAIYSKGILRSALYWDNSKALWEKEGAKIAAFSIDFYSKLAGQYLYPNLFMCETYEGGMEYPGLVFIGPYTDPEYHWAQNTMMHEIGHEWYPMMMGSNETDYGYMDEGFNTFITTLAHEAYFGRYNNSYGPNTSVHDDERQSNYRGAMIELQEATSEPSEQKADMFRSYRAYANATYDRTGTVFLTLRHTMGEPAFNDFLHEYYRRWHFKHPYPDDLRQAAEDINRGEGDTNRVKARGDLRWFFDQFFRTTWKCDYKVSNFSTSGNNAKVEITRVERAVAPVDLEFTFEDGTKETRWIPVDDWQRTTVRERNYDFTFQKHPVRVEINPGRELFEINRLNNSSDWLPKMNWELWPKFTGDAKPVDAYAIRSAPFFYPGFASTIKGKLNETSIGWTLLGSYLERDDRLALGFRLTNLSPSATNPGLREWFVLQYHTILDAFSPNTDLDLGFFGWQQSGIGAPRLSVRGAQLFTSPSGSTPHHSFNVLYDWVNRRQEPRGSSEVPSLNRYGVGYTFHNTASVTDFAFATQFESSIGDPSNLYTKFAATSNLRVDLSADWNVYLRAFVGIVDPQPGYSDYYLDYLSAYSRGFSQGDAALFNLTSPGVFQDQEDIYLSNFGSNQRSKIRNPVASGPMMRLGQTVNETGTRAGSVTIEIGNNSLFPFTFLRSIPILGVPFKVFGLVLFADAGLVTDRFCTCNLKNTLRKDAGIGLRLQWWNLWQYGVDLSRTELQFDFPIYVDDPSRSFDVTFPQKKLALRFQAMVRQNF